MAGDQQFITFQPPVPASPVAHIVGVTAVEPFPVDVAQPDLVLFQRPPEPPPTPFTAPHLQLAEPIQQVFTPPAYIPAFQPAVPRGTNIELKSVETFFAAPQPVVFPVFPFVDVHVTPQIAINAIPFSYAAATKIAGISAFPLNTSFPAPVAIGCNLTVANLKQRCWERLDDDGTYYTPDRVLRALNTAQNLWCLLTLCIEKTATIPLTAAQPFYALSGAGVTDFIVPLRALYVNSRLRTATLNQLHQRGSWRAIAGPPTHYYQQGVDLLAVYPQPRSSDPLTLSLTYAAYPPALVNDYDLPSIATENQPYLADAATYILRMFEGDAELKLTEPFLTRFLDAAQKYGAFIRARSKAQAYDTFPFDLASYDRGRLIPSLIAAARQGGNRRAA